MTDTFTNLPPGYSYTASTAGQPASLHFGAAFADAVRAAEADALKPDIYDALGDAFEKLVKALRACAEAAAA